VHPAVAGRIKKYWFITDQQKKRSTFNSWNLRDNYSVTAPAVTAVLNHLLKKSLIKIKSLEGLHRYTFKPSFEEYIVNKIIFL
jgi:predicted transcriptional regulator